jgi:hypothetical protein
MYYLLSFNPVLHVILKKLYPTWFFDDVIRYMNLVRSIGDYSIAQEIVFKKMGIVKKVVYRYVPESFPNFYLDCSSSVKCKKSGQCLDSLEGEFENGDKKGATISERKDAVDAFFDILPQNVSLNLQILSLFRCSKGSINILSEMHEKHQKLLHEKNSDTTKQMHNTEMARLFKRLPIDDRVVIDHFFTAWSSQRVISSVKIRSKSFVSKQIEIITKNYGPVPPKSAIFAAFAKCCNQELRSVIARQNTATLGTSSTTFDFATDEVMCEARGHKILSSKRESEACKIKFEQVIGEVVQADRLSGKTGGKRSKKVKQPICSIGDPQAAGAGQKKKKKGRKKKTNNGEPERKSTVSTLSPLTVQPCCGNIGLLSNDNFSPCGAYLCAVCRLTSVHHKSFVSPTCICCESTITKNFVSLPRRHSCKDCGSIYTDTNCLKCEKDIVPDDENILPETKRAMFYILLDDTLDVYELCYLCKDCYKPWQQYNMFIFRLSILRMIYRQTGPPNRQEEMSRLCREL